MSDLSGLGFIVALMIVFGFCVIGLGAYLESTLTPEQICAKQIVVQSDYCKALTTKTQENK